MFDNPKKELERLEQQLLAAESDEPEAVEEEFDDLCDEIYDEFDGESPYERDDDLWYILNEEESPLSSRAAGFDAEEEEYFMDSDRYAPAPKKKGIGGLVFFALMLALSSIALAIWWLGRLL